MAGLSRTKTRFLRRLVLLGLTMPLVLLAFGLTSTSAFADSRVQFLADRLKYPPAAGQPDDFRVRTNAALALGTTNDDAAVAPLCGGLDDPSEVVRQSVAVAFKRLLRPVSLDCMQRRVAIETNAGVKTQLQRAIEAVQAAGGGSGGNSGGGTAPPAWWPAPSTTSPSLP